MRPANFIWNPLMAWSLSVWWVPNATLIKKCQTLCILFFTFKHEQKNRTCHSYVYSQIHARKLSFWYLIWGDKEMNKSIYSWLLNHFNFLMAMANKDVCLPPGGKKVAIFIWLKLRPPSTPYIGSYPSMLAPCYWNNSFQAFSSYLMIFDKLKSAVGQYKLYTFEGEL